MSEDQTNSGFAQPRPQLANQYRTDRVLQGYLHRHLPPDLLHACEAELEAMGDVAVTMWQQQLSERLLEPSLTQWDPWGERIDQIELTALWHQARDIAAKSGLVATAYEGNFQPYGRLVQFALVYLFHPSSDMFCCPLAMTDGAARALLDSGNEELVHRAVGHLTSRDPTRFWTSGQWMTETSGGSDLSRTETVAKKTHDGWALTGKKWFTSAATSEMALTLARPEGSATGSNGLALFYVEPWDQQSGRLRNIEILRLKDKLGTRKLPTAELQLSDTPAALVADHSGIKAISPMLNITRTWNAVCATGFMRRSIALARDYAGKREAFGQPLANLPLHQQTLARLQADFEACFHLTFHVVQELGLSEHRQLGQERQTLLRLLIPLAKLLTGKKVVEVTSEALECFGGAGYVEDTGIATLLRDAQVLPIWEGTTNVLSLDVLSVLRNEETLAAWSRFMRKRLRRVDHSDLLPTAELTSKSLKQTRRWVKGAADFSNDLWQYHARDLALTLARISAAVLTLDQAQHDLDTRQDPRSGFAARVFVEQGLSLLDSPIGDELNVCAKLGAEV